MSCSTGTSPEFAAHCGIYEVGSTKLVESLQSHPEDNPLPLHDIFTRYPKRVVYWVCCREVTAPEEDVLRNSPGSFLTAPPD